MEQQETQKAKFTIKFKDQFGNVTYLEKEFDAVVLEEVGESTFDYLVENFKNFLITSEFSEESINERIN